jgi:hypothetical protein
MWMLISWESLATSSQTQSSSGSPHVEQTSDITVWLYETEVLNTVGKATSALEIGQYHGMNRSRRPISRSPTAIWRRYWWLVL